MINGKAWENVNTLLAFLGKREIELIDEFYKRHGNTAPGNLLREQLALVQKDLDEGSRDSRADDWWHSHL